jgi:hypothetical protein
MERYGAVRMLAFVLKMASWLVLVAGGVVAVVAAGSGWTVSLSVAIGTVVTWMVCAAQGQLLDIAADVGHATTRAADALDRMTSAQVTATAAAPSAPDSALAARPDAPAERPCPHCGKVIKSGASKCMHCWKAVSPA